MPEAVLQVIQQGIDALWEQKPAKADELSRWKASIASSMQVVPEEEIRETLDAMMATRQLKHLCITNPKTTKPRIPHILHVAATAIIKQLPIASLMTNNAFATIHLHFPLPGVINPATAEWTLGCEYIVGRLNRWRPPTQRPRRAVVCSIPFRPHFHGLRTSSHGERGSACKPVPGAGTSRAIPSKRKVPCVVVRFGGFGGE
ncbi:hypothetical protein [Pseudaminobacter sp. NGMCC 1.201702]|uniref:hypothetical protein n=1 Tax=Pseudaminobacter sp. NGMCC 1.201702 TaxID=3391825 RepID=UPI0039F018D4